LRALRAEDADAFLDYRSDPEVARFQGWSRMDASTACEFIKTMESVTGPRDGAWIQLGIVLRESDLLIGDIGLWLGNDGKAARIGYSCAPRFQRQGLTTEAMHVLINALVHFTPCETVHALVDPRNAASKRLLLRLCFRQAETAGAAPGGCDIDELSYELDLRDRRSVKKPQPGDIGK
jgi:RimJ/RimL family protein N-acetyltransferase